LQIGVRGDHDLTARGRESCRKAGRLAKITSEPDDAPAGVPLVDVAQAGEAVVGASVVYDDDLVRPADLVQRSGKLAVQRLYILGLIIERDDNRKEWRHVISFGGSGAGPERSKALRRAAPWPR